MNYTVRISPVQRNQNSVSRYLTRYLGSGEASKARDLVRNGGVVSDDLSRSEADTLAKDLRGLGVVTEVTENENIDTEDGYQVALLDAGSKTIAVIKEVRAITGSSLKEARELVDNLGVVGTYPTKKEAERGKEILTAAGAKVKIEKKSAEPEAPKENVMFAAKVNGNPAQFTIQLNGDVTDLERVEEVMIGDDSNVDDDNMSRLFTLSISDADSLKMKGLTMVIKYKF